MSSLISLTEAVVAELNSASFSQPITATRGYRPHLDPEALKELVVLAIPRETSITFSGRRVDAQDIAIDVGVFKAIDDSDNTEADALMGLVEEIYLHFRRRELEGAACVRIENSPIFDPEDLESRGQFSSLITLTFKKVA